MFFVDFSSATTQPHNSVPPDDQETSSSQHPSTTLPLGWQFPYSSYYSVRIDTSSTSDTARGAPFFYTLYTNDCTSPSPITIYFRCLPYLDYSMTITLLQPNKPLCPSSNNGALITTCSQTWTKQTSWSLGHHTPHTVLNHLSSMTRQLSRWAASNITAGLTTDNKPFRSTHRLCTVCCPYLLLLSYTKA